MKRNKDSTFSGVLVQYDLSSKEKDLFNDWHSINLNNKIKIYNIYYTSDDISDPAFQFWRQVNLFMQSQPQIVQNFNNEFHYVFYFVHTYFTANGGMTINNKQYISDVLLLLSNWYYDQTYVGFDTDEKLHFALQAEKYALENNIPLADLVDLLEDWTDPSRVKPTTRFKNHAKLNSIYNQAKISGNFNQHLKKFEPTFSVAHLLLDIGPVNDPTYYAQTNPPVNYWIKMIFNENKDWSNIPKVVIADTFMHEMIHAEIFRKLLSLASNNGNIDVNLVMQYLNSHNYPGLFDYYVKRTVGNENWQHELMAAHYVESMVEYLKQVYGNQYSDIEYQTVVWFGLKGTIAWNQLPESTRKLYEKTWDTNYYLWEL